MTPIRLATFNVLFGHQTTGPGSWSERRPLLRRAIEAARADVVGLQEVFPSKLSDAAELVAPLKLVPGPASGPPRWFDVSRAIEPVVGALRTLRLPDSREGRAPSERMVTGEHLPIAYRPDRFEPLDAGGFWISTTPERPGSRLPLAPSPFLVHWLRLAPSDGSGELLVMNAHFGHAPWHHAPTEQVVTAQLGALEASRVRPPGAGGAASSVFLLGDFNAVPSSRLVRGLTSPEGAGFVDASRSAARRSGPGVTYHWGTGATRLGLKLDYVLARTRLRAAHSEVVDVHEGRLYPSDHHLLVLEFAPPVG